MNLYQDRILSYYKNQTFIGTVPDENFKSDGANPSCGDRIELSARFEQGVCVAMKYTGVGCVISRAAAAMVCEYATGKTQSDLLQLTDANMQNFFGLEFGPNRLRCATLVLEALRKGLNPL